MDITGRGGYISAGIVCKSYGRRADGGSAIIAIGVAALLPEFSGRAVEGCSSLDAGNTHLVP